MTVRSRHTEWCAGSHRCGLGEHRSQPISVDVPNAGVGVLTRVCDANGRQYAEIRLRVVLPADEGGARRYLVALLSRLPTLMKMRAE